jgi:hypothetical protein
LSIVFYSSEFPGNEAEGRKADEDEPQQHAQGHILELMTSEVQIH